MKRILLLAALFAASAFAALKPGYRYHRDVLPSDQVPADFETVMSNYLAPPGTSRATSRTRRPSSTA